MAFAASDSISAADGARLREFLQLAVTVSRDRRLARIRAVQVGFARNTGNEAGSQLCNRGLKVAFVARVCSCRAANQLVEVLREGFRIAVDRIRANCRMPEKLDIFCAATAAPSHHFVRGTQLRQRAQYCPSPLSAIWQQHMHGKASESNMD